MMITCTQCFSPVYPEQIIDRENDWCEDCYEKWFREEMAYWQPLYEGEKQAGLLIEATPLTLAAGEMLEMLERFVRPSKDVTRYDEARALICRARGET